MAEEALARTGVNVADESTDESGATELEVEAEASQELGELYVSDDTDEETDPEAAEEEDQEEKEEVEEEEEEKE